MSSRGRGEYTRIFCVWQVKSVRKCKKDGKSLILRGGEGGGEGGEVAGVAVKGADDGGVHEGFSAFLRQGVMEFEDVYHFADDGAGGGEEQLWHGDFVCREDAEDFFIVLFAEDGHGDDDAGDDVEGEAYGGAVGQLCPFIVVCGFATVGKLPGFAAKKDSAEVNLSHAEEEQYGGEPVVEALVVVSGAAEDDADDEDE